ncbi:hypothetical protein [Anaerorhabdus furcosa]|uniref:Uncharacterized protein n=1 Tax=Anaerorhabdus furcosa TaxID=118967 RepID=A0A1T4LYY7_9FIRM|nr:hypothetical protein [Anaerorhabdus furcosa]SJZ59940.1 hypothetical protein SAMN02745191_1115 [Anaerorhabdus furcosa]
MEKEVYTITELKQLGYPDEICRNYTRSKGTQAMRNGLRGKWLIPKDHFNTWLQQQKKSSSPGK